MVRLVNYHQGRVNFDFVEAPYKGLDRRDLDLAIGCGEACSNDSVGNANGLELV